MAGGSVSTESFGAGVLSSNGGNVTPSGALVVASFGAGVPISNGGKVTLSIGAGVAFSLLSLQIVPVMSWIRSRS